MNAGVVNKYLPVSALTLRLWCSHVSIGCHVTTLSYRALGFWEIFCSRLILFVSTWSEWPRMKHVKKGTEGVKPPQLRKELIHVGVFMRHREAQF